MTLFLYLATPLFVIAVAAQSDTGRGGRAWALLSHYAAAALLALPIYPLIDLLAGVLPAGHEPRLWYLRLLAVDHGLPLLAALAVSLCLRRPASRRGLGSVPEPAPLIASLGGFYSMYALLEQFTLHMDPSPYRLVALPLTRLAAVGATAYVVARAASSGKWWRCVAVLPIPLVTAGVGYGSVLQRPVLTAAGSALLLAVTLPLAFATRTSEASDDRTA